MSSAHDLASFQATIKAYLLHGTQKERLIGQARGGGAPVEDRLAVYRRAFYIRLERALANDFPVAHRYLGDRRFKTLAGDYVRVHPSRHPDIRQLGEGFPAWLLAQGELLAADLASVEWAVLEAFQAADASPLRPADLAAVPPPAWFSIELRLHPTVRVLVLSSDAADIWRTVRNVNAQPEPTLGAPRTVVVWRRSEGVTALAPEPMVASLLQAAGAKATLAALLDQLDADTASVPEQVARALLDAATAGWLTHAGSEGAQLTSSVPT